MSAPVAKAQQPPGAIEAVADCACQTDDPVDCDSATDWGYICERADYWAWFGVDLSSVAPGTQINSLTFTAYIYFTDDEDSQAQRTLWYSSDDSWIGDGCPSDYDEGELVATITHVEGADGWVTFTIDLTGHDWQNDLADGYITLMLTGPLNYDHICGEVDMIESGNAAYLMLNGGGAVIPTLGHVSLLGLAGLLAALAFWWLRRR